MKEITHQQAVEQAIEAEGANFVLGILTRSFRHRLTNFQPENEEVDKEIIEEIIKLLHHMNLEIDRMLTT